MKTLLLTSAGMQVKDEIVNILPKPPSQIKLAHIVTATNVVKDAPWRDRDETKLIEAGFQVKNIDIVGKTGQELMILLRDSDVIYVQGDDPYYLLKHVKASGFDTVVKDLIQKGKMYIGVSAGTYIACPSMEMALWKKPNRPRYGLTRDESCMNLIPFLVCVHYEPKFKNVVKQGMQRTTYPVKILTDDQALLVQNDHIQLVGQGSEVAL